MMGRPRLIESEKVGHRRGRTGEGGGELREVGIGGVEAAGRLGRERVEPTRVECSQWPNVDADRAAAAALDGGAAVFDMDGPAAGVVGEDVVGDVEIEIDGDVRGPAAGGEGRGEIDEAEHPGEIHVDLAAAARQELDER